MDSGTLAYETTLVARTEGFSSSLERERAEGRRGMEPKSWNRTNLHFRVQPDLASARHTDKLCYQSRTNQLYSLHCAFMHETSSRFWANFRPPSSVPPAIRLELLFRAINARRYAGQEDNSEKCFGRILYDRSDLAVITRFW